MLGMHKKPDSYEDFVLWLLREGYLSYAQYREILLRLKDIAKAIELSKEGGPHGQHVP